MPEKDVKELTRQAVAGAAISAAISDLVTENRKELAKHLDPGEKQPARDADGTKLGEAWMTDPKPALAVVDSEAFIAWVEEHHPDEVEVTTHVTKTVRDSFRKALIAAKGRAEVTDETTGEITEVDVPGIAMKAAGSPTLTVKPNDEAKERAARLVSQLQLEA